MKSIQELVPVNLGIIGGETLPTTSAKNLHTFLQVGRDFTNWIKGRISQYGFIEGVDYLIIDGCSQINQFTPERAKTSQGGRPWADYLLTIDMGKQIAMVERNAKGQEVRRYFIECERQVKAAQILVPHTMPEALRLAADLAEKLMDAEAKIISDAPKVDFSDLVSSIEKGISISNYAKTVGIGPLKLFTWLRDMGILIAGGQRHNLPMQRYIDSGYFSVRQGTYDTNGETRASFTTMLSGKGELWLTKKLADGGMLSEVPDAK